MKYDALAGAGIEIGERVPIPDGLIPDDARVEMEAKKAAGYFTPQAADRRRAEGDGRAQDRGILSLGDADAARSLPVGAAPCASARTRCWRPGCAASSRISPSTSTASAIAAQVVSELIRENYPDLQRAVPRALAPFRRRRARSVGRARGADRMGLAGREGARGVRSRDHLGAARCRRRPAWRYLDPGDRAGRSRAPKASRSRACACSRPARSRRSRRSAARRCRAADAAQAEDVARRLPEHGRQPAGRPRRPRRAARAARRGGRGAAGPVRARGSRAAGRALRSSRRAAPRTARFRRRASSKRCSSISGRSGRAG